jgi:FKBP-type peptidyl-prolyl cis-trans isomerase FkpA
MIRFFKITFITSFCLLSLVACKKDDTVEPTPITPFATQEPIDFAKLDTFLDTYSMSVSSDYDVTFTPIPTPNPANLVNIRTQFAADLKLKNAIVGDVSHRFYFIELRKGTQLAPSRVDSVFVSYRGRLLDNTTFDQAQNPTWLRLDNVIQGWREVFPQFKTGTFTNGAGGTVDYQNFGAGVMFLPSALAYYNQGTGSIPGYAPLIFNFKLKHLNYIDHDFDRIDSKDEDINGDGQFNNDDTDGDGRQDYLDQDDDGDGFLTKAEIRNPAGGYYDFASIPLCNGKKKHLTAIICN